MIDVKLNSEQWIKQGFPVIIITNSGKSYFTLQAAKELKHKLDAVLIDIELEMKNK